MCVNWITTRYKVILTIKLDLQKYQQSEYILPPPELGKCTDWRFEVSTNEKTAIFKAVWDKRRFNDDISLDTINERIKEYSVK